MPDGQGRGFNFNDHGFRYMTKRLVEANLNNDPAILDEITRLLTELQDAWSTIRPQVVQPATA